MLINEILGKGDVVRHVKELASEPITNGNVGKSSNRTNEDNENDGKINVQVGVTTKVVSVVVPIGEHDQNIYGRHYVMERSVKTEMAKTVEKLMLLI